MSTAYLDLLWAASRERFGIIVETNNPDRLQQLLYTARRANIGDFANIRLTIFNGRVWILRREGLQEVEDDAENLREPDPT